MNSGPYGDLNFYEQERQRARFAGGRRGMLLGLPVVPWGVMSLLLVAQESGVWAVGEGWALVLLLAAFLASVGLHLLERRQYALPPLRIGPGFLVEAVVICGILAIALTFLIIDTFLAPIVSLTGILLAAMLWVFWRYYGEDRAHYALMAVIVAGVAALPLTGMVEASQLFANPPVMGTAVGIIFIVGGYLDHRLISRAMNPSRRKDD